MNEKAPSIKNDRLRRWIIALLFLAIFLALTSKVSQSLDLIHPALAGSGTQRRVNVPYLGAAPGAGLFTPAIFWFGQVDRTSNYADTRIYYYDDYLKVVFHIMDRMLWRDTTPSASDLTNWDAISLYFNLDGNVGTVPGANAYQFEVMLDNFQATLKGNGSGWSSASLPFTPTTVWRGSQGPNSNTDAEGWQAEIVIPFTSFGLSQKPPTGTIWGLAVALHDRDDANGTMIRTTTWPEAMDTNAPATWGSMRFGVPAYNPPAVSPSGTYTIRQGLNGVTVKDAEVGGHTICGGPIDKWTEWGIANYAGYSQINIQNQWDISDWPCFSKYYITFPLDSLPKNQLVISASFSMYLFGNAWGPPPNSYILALTVGEDWDENTINWNNAPLATENISGTWVYPVQNPPNWDLYTWDISRALADAYQNGIPLRLAFYSIAGEMHSGKYFTSSDWSEEEGRPWLSVVLGDGGTGVPNPTSTLPAPTTTSPVPTATPSPPLPPPCGTPGNPCHYLYIPVTTK